MQDLAVKGGFNLLKEIFTKTTKEEICNDSIGT